MRSSTLLAVLIAAVIGACGEDGASGRDGAGGSGSGDGGSGPAGTFEGAWRPASVDYIVQTFTPLSITEESVTLPGTVDHPVLGEEIELIHEIRGSARISYVRAVGKDEYVFWEEPIVVAGDSLIAGGDLLSLEGGELVLIRYDQVQDASGPVGVLTSKLRFARVGGAVPPAGWPTQGMELE